MTQTRFFLATIEEVFHEGAERIFPRRSQCDDGEQVDGHEA
jgi:hypothetical protein